MKKSARISLVSLKVYRYKNGRKKKKNVKWRRQWKIVNFVEGKKKTRFSSIPDILCTCVGPKNIFVRLKED